MLVVQLIQRPPLDENTSRSLRGALTPDDKNVVNATLVPPEKVLLPPLHKKLGLMKQFIKSLPKDVECFRYMCSKFPKLSEAKMKEEVFTGPDIRKAVIRFPLFRDNGGQRKRSVGLFLRM
ncbi:hypothetical protein AVEN_55284-1 [Araneus ventricosus]|uniref:Uncharacterized protein n=1 Tax=Araneus ventricosus TaxID=182803 RepID=A0A4Y2D8N7_ARAVE|nr:hypothetical protein AVEN_55284-1 [Araneus ventricosus]